LAFLQAYNRAKAVNSNKPKTVSFLIGLKILVRNWFDIKKVGQLWLSYPVVFVC